MDLSREKLKTSFEGIPEEQGVKFINIAKHMLNHDDYKGQIEGNPGSQNWQLALENPIQHVFRIRQYRAHPKTALVYVLRYNQSSKRALDSSIFSMLTFMDLNSDLLSNGVSNGI